MALGGAQINRDRSLVAIVELERRTDARVGIAHRARDEAANRIAGGRVLELDDVGPPIAEHGASGGASDPHCNFYDSDSFERTVHGNVILLKPARILHFLGQGYRHRRGPLHLGIVR